VTGQLIRRLQDRRSPQPLAKGDLSC